METQSFLPVVSQLLGWVYTILWSLSFYPQPILNCRRRSTSGTTIDFSILNILGFISYLTYNTTFYYSDKIRLQYSLRNGGLEPTVQLNDIAYALHALILSLITLSQFFLSSWWGFDHCKRRLGARPSKGIWVTIAGCIVAVLAVVIIVLVRHDENPRRGWATIDVIYAISYVKLVATLFKYIPQVKINYQNNSTIGWSVDQILLDLSGGIASIMQLGIDSYYQADWSGVTGNPAKLLLGNISIFFDIIFLVQHYCLYRDRNTPYVGEEDPLLRGRQQMA